MIDQSNIAIKTLPPIWEYVSTAEFTVPSPPVTSAVRGGIAGLWQRLKPERNTLDAPLKTEEQLQDLSNSVLSCVASEPDWRTAAISLETKLADWIDAESKGIPAVVVIGQPYSGNQEILHALAAEQDLQVLSPPTAEQILSLYEMPYRIGDWISIDGAYGEVKSINMRNVEITTPDDTVVVIPHLKLWNTLIFNANDGSQNLQCAADFYLYPRHDSTLVMHALYDVGLTSSYLQIKKNPPMWLLKKSPGARIIG